MAEKKIKGMSIEELRNEIRKYCEHQVKNGSCDACVLSGIHHLDDINTFHKSVGDIDDRFTLGLMVALIRGYLVWDNRKEFNTGSNVPEQPTVPPMPEPVKSVINQVTELTASIDTNLVDGYADATQIVIAGKKPTSMTVFYDQEGGGD